jgi:hypothetical protein
MIFILAIFLFMTTPFAVSQALYRTFSQDQLFTNKVKMGKVLDRSLVFTFRNALPDTVRGLFLTFNKQIHFWVGSQEFSSRQEFADKPFSIFLKAPWYNHLAPDESTNVIVSLGKAQLPAVNITSWYWADDTMRQIGPLNPGKTSDGVLVGRQQPSGGNVREYMYKRVVPTLGGIVVGIPKPESSAFYGWFRYTRNDKKEFVHTGNPRGLDFILKGGHVLKPLYKEIKNPEVRLHNNHLVGELHALKLAIAANDAGVTEPILQPGTTLFGDLLFRDTVIVTTIPVFGDTTWKDTSCVMCDGLTIRQIAHLADSALTFLGRYDWIAYRILDGCISVINTTFAGDLSASAFEPLLITGSRDIGTLPWLLQNPAASLHAERIQQLDRAKIQPEQFRLEQNYPNPFNPTTAIEFSLRAPGIVRLGVYNILGQQIATLIDNQEMLEGEQEIEFDASNIPSGVYFYRLLVQEDEGGATFHSMKKMIVIK